MSGDEEYLTLWTIYDHPKDYPHGYIARVHRILRGETEATGSIVTAPDLETIRKLMAQKGLFCLGREAADDPVIVESWL